MNTFQDRAERAAHRLALADKFLAAHKAYHTALAIGAPFGEVDDLSRALGDADDTLAAAYREEA